MGRPAKNLLGKKFGSLTVIEDAGFHVKPSGSREKLWKCKCDCGAITNVIGSNLTCGSVASCGCSKAKKRFDEDVISLKYEEMEFKAGAKNIGIIDADLLFKDRHRFPNLACMKLSGYYKEMGYHVALLLNYNNLERFDKVFISKVFTDTEVPEDVLSLGNVEYGGTGFYFDKAPDLPYEIEHHMPDYHLYDWFIYNNVSSLPSSKREKKLKEFKFYTDYSIGYTTRGCFRKCGFCVNKKYNKCQAHSNIKEFLDEDRPKISLLDDNILACKDWRNILEELNNTGKKFHFNQGIDLRLVTDEVAEYMSHSNFEDVRFAFDNIKDKDTIISKLDILSKYNSLSVKYVMYILAGFDPDNVYDDAFWERDIKSVFDRINIVTDYKIRPFVCRFNQYKNFEHDRMYDYIANWTNYTKVFVSNTFREYLNVSKPRAKYINAFEKIIGESLDINYRYKLNKNVDKM